MNITAITSLIGVLVGLVGVISPILNRRDKLLRIRKLNEAWSKMPVGPGRDALGDARDRLALKLSLPILAPMQSTTTFLRNATGVVAVVVFLGVLSQYLPASWFEGASKTNTAVPGFFRAISPTVIWCIGLISGGVAAFCQGRILATRDNFIDNELPRRLAQHEG